MADSLDQAAEDLARSWGRSRRIGWAIDTATPVRDPLEVEVFPHLAPKVSASLRHARLVAEREALAAVIPTDPGRAVDAARTRVQRLELALRDLDGAEGWGMLRDTPVGDAAIAWHSAGVEQGRCLAQAKHVGWRERRQLRQQAARAAERQGPLREAFDRLAGPERARITAELSEANTLFDDLDGQRRGYYHFRSAHPEALRRLEGLDRQIAATAWDLDVDRQDLDGIAAKRPKLEGQGWGIEREGPVLDRGIDLGR